MQESVNQPGLDVEREESAILLGGIDSHAAPARAAASEEQIRMRAYQLYCERDGKAGDDIADWLRAEREYLEHAPRTTADPAGNEASAS